MALKITEGKSDLAGLKALAELCLDNYTLPMQKLSAKASLPDFTILFASEGGKKVGFIAGHGENGKMHIWLFGVLKKKRGRGIGKRLLGKFHVLASKKGYNSVSTITFNKYAQKIILSIREGYRITGVKFIPEKNDTAIFLEKGL